MRIGKPKRVHEIREPSVPYEGEEREEKAPKPVAREEEQEAVSAEHE